MNKLNSLPLIIVEEIPAPPTTLAALDQAEDLSKSLCQLYEDAINSGVSEAMCDKVENNLIAAMHLVLAVERMTIELTKSIAERALHH